VWTIASGPHPAPWSGRDATGWGWILTNDRGDRHPVTVWVSGTAMAVAPEFLPPETAEARASNGQSEIQRLLDDAILPREVMMHTAGRSVDPGEAGWWVELRGTEQALQVLSRLLVAGGDPEIAQRGGQYFLRAKDFEEMADEQEVRLSAARIIRETSGAAWLDGDEIDQVEVGVVQRLAE
jgi:hypothetical protein